MASGLVQLTSGCRLEGKLVVAGDALVDCELNGELEVSGALTIGAAAKVDGKVSAETLLILGSVRGDLLGQTRLELKEGADVEGTLTSPRLVIEDGVRFVGQCAMPKREQIA